MVYRKLQPCQSLQPFIECYYLWRGTVASEKKVQSPPNGFCSLVFNFGDHYQTYQGTAVPIYVPTHFVSGQFTSNYHLVLNGTIDIVGVVFKPSSLFNFFGLRMSNLVNNRVDINLMLTEANEVANLLMGNREPDEVKKALDAFFMGRLPQAIKKLSFVDQAVDFIDQQNGACTVDDLSHRLHVSRRYLEKKFAEKVGISPKFYARLRRFSVLSNLVVHQSKPNWQQLLVDAGFHDQSHFIKEFIEFNQMTPSEYFEHHQELIRWLKP